MFNRAAVEARLETATDNPRSEFDEHYICKCLVGDFRATLAALDAATATADGRLRLLEAAYQERDAATATARVAELEAQSDPTVHALAVLGARVLAAYYEQGPHCSSYGAIIERSGLTEGGASTHYATPQIAATVAALTQTGGSDAAK